MGSLNPNTVEFIAMYEEENMRSAELREEVDAPKVHFEAIRSKVLSAERSIHYLGLYYGSRLDTRLYN